MTDHAAAGALTVVIADDEDLARRRITELLRGRSDIRLLAECASGPATLDALRRSRPDILFLDVQMPGLTGFDVLAALAPEERPVVIFSTAYDEYALAAFEVHAVDYLLKPFADDRFAESLRRAEEAIRTRGQDVLHDRLRALLEQVGSVVEPSGETSAAPASTLDRFAVPDGERLAVIDAAGVDWIESVGDYVRIHAGEMAPVVRATLAMLERRLDPARFLRIHRSTIIQLDRVRQLQSDGHGEYTVVLKAGERLRVGRTYRDLVLRRLGAQW